MSVGLGCPSLIRHTKKEFRQEGDWTILSCGYRVFFVTFYSIAFWIIECDLSWNAIKFGLSSEERIHPEGPVDVCQKVFFERCPSSSFLPSIRTGLRSSEGVSRNAFVIVEWVAASCVTFRGGRVVLLVIHLRGETCRDGARLSKG